MGRSLAQNSAPAGRPHPPGAHCKGLLGPGRLGCVSALAGHGHAASGRRYVRGASANHPGAEAARPVFEALQQWTLQDQASKDPARSATKPQAAGAKKKPVLKSLP